MRSGKGPRATRSEAMAAEKRRSDQVAVDKDGETMANEEEELEEAKRFFACYLLTSLSPRHKGRTYIGFTVNPRRRIRQHNGEIRCGAWRTKSGRPWEMTLCIYGFPSNVSALQFEWAWQHPRESLAVRKAASSFKSLSGIANKIKLAYTMLSLPAWESLGLTVNFFSTKYMKHAAGCPKLPKQMRTVFCVMDELPCYVEGSIFEKDNEEDEEEENLIEDSTSMCLDVSGDHVEVDVSSGHDFGTWSKYYDDSTSMCLDVSGDHVEVDVSSGHDFGTWSKYYDDFRESTALEEEEPCPSESLKATKVSVGNVAGVSNLMATSVVNDLGDADIGTPVVTTEPYFLIESPEHVQEDSRTTSSGITQLSSSEDTFDFLKQTNLENLSHQSTPTSSSKKAPSGRLFRSPENNVINLVSPPDFLIRPSRNKRKKSPHHLHIIDLTDSPVSL